MEITRSERGFASVSHPMYPPDKDAGIGPYAGQEPDRRIITKSSIVGDYDDALNRPGTSALWIGCHHHLNREQVAELVEHMQSWLETGKFKGETEVKRDGTTNRKIKRL